jgi:hypothetical protein
MQVPVTNRRLTFLMITILRECTRDEREQHRRYLAGSNVAVFSQLLAAQQGFKLELAIQDSAEDHGGLQSIFETLGSVRVEGQRRYLVNQVYGVLASLEQPSENDSKMLASIKWWMARADEGILTGRAKITILVDSVGQLVDRGDYVIIDGNKSSVAFYKSRRTKDERLEALPVYVIKPLT